MLELYSSAMAAVAGVSRLVRWGMSAIIDCQLTQQEKDKADELLVAIYDAAQDFNQQMHEIADGYDAAQLEEENSNG